MYPIEIVQPMKNDLTNVGFNELTTAAAVDHAIENSKGTMVMVVNSVCGCAAGNMRPGVKKSLEHSVVPNELFTVFAGFDTEATNQARKYFLPYRTKKQYAEIVSFIKLFRQEDITLKRILADYSVKMGQYVNEPKLRKELREAFGFSKSAIDSILSIH